MNRKKLLHLFVIPLIFIATMILTYFNKSYKIIVLIAIVYIIYNLYILTYYLNKENDDVRLVSYLNKCISKDVNNIIIPVVLIEKSGKIIWNNQKFDEIIENTNAIGKNISDIVRGINIDGSINNDEKQKIIFKERVYDLKIDKVVSEYDVIYLLYFNDITELIGVNEIKENVVLIEVDNLNEVLEVTGENERPLLIAEIERNLNLYAHSMNAYIQKYSNNKFLLSVQDKYIEEQILDKFSIMKKIAKINKGNRFEITLSIGIGRGGISPQENYKFATIAKELALGRGGDQVVIKANDDIKFVGGTSKELEKRTRVRARVVSQALKELIFESDKVYIMGHKNPDMDCFGSGVALSSCIRRLGKQCQIILKNDIKPIQYFYNKLKDNKEYEDRFISVEEAYQNIDDNTLMIITDVHNKSYVSDYELLKNIKKKVIIDHHRRSPDIIEGAILNYIEVYASSTSEMVTEMIQYLEKTPQVPIIEAEGLLAGIFMDTKSFSFKTGVRTFEAASFLRNVGADTIEVKKMFTENLENYLIIAEAIKTAKVDERYHAAIAVCPKNVDTVIIAKSADELLNISGIQVAFALAEIGDEIYISGRSVGDINVQIVLESLGGGGHMNIAGAKVVGKTIEEVIDDLKNSMNKNLRMGE